MGQSFVACTLGIHSTNHVLWGDPDWGWPQRERLMYFSEDFSYQCPLKINCGSHALAGLPSELTAYDVNHPFILVSRHQIKAKPIQTVVDAFRSFGMTVAMYDQIPDQMEPNLLPMLLTLYQDGGCDSLIAIGGNAVVDAAKCLNVLVAVNARSKKIGTTPGEGGADALTPLFLVATPGGNGYEATHWANDTSGLLCAARLMPSVAFIDPVMMEGRQRDVVNGGLIGLAHAVEAFLDDAAGPLARAHAHTAISLMMHYLPMAVGGDEYPQSLSGVVCGQIVAGCAFSAASPGVCHTLANHLAAYTELPKGYLMALFLPYRLAETSRQDADQVGQLLYPMVGAQDFALTARTLQAPRAIAILWELYDALNQTLTVRIPIRLKKAGLTDDQLKKAQGQLMTASAENALVNIFSRAI
ncbi:iron-containing alcohol dehydrogenase [Desulfosarcina variabilis]|uniref:iron-containing alcohol dehydrogenase n=1 Tax=Desulfosarcina variabilis TaxID=2300 RepID=UPI003AFA19AF